MTERRNVVNHLVERGDPLSLWAAQTIQQLRQKNAVLAERSSVEANARRANKAEGLCELYESLWRQSRERVSALLMMWRPLADEIVRIKGLGTKHHSINDINEDFDKSCTGRGSIYIKEFIPDGIRVTDLRKAIMEALQQTPKRPWYKRFMRGK